MRLNVLHKFTLLSIGVTVLLIFGVGLLVSTILSSAMLRQEAASS